MKTIMLAAAAVLAVGVGVAHAADGGGAPPANTSFTMLPGVIAKAPVQTPVPAPSTMAAGQPGSTTSTFVTSHSGAISLFAPNPNEGANN